MVLEHLGDTRWRAASVFKNHEVARPGADDVNACNVGIDIPWHRKAVHVRDELRVPEHQLGRDVTGTYKVARSVRTSKEPIESPDPLRKSAVKEFLFLSVNQSGNDVQRDQPLTISPFAVHRERDPLRRKTNSASCLRCERNDLGVRWSHASTSR